MNACVVISNKQLVTYERVLLEIAEKAYNCNYIQTKGSALALISTFSEFYDRKKIEQLFNSIIPQILQEFAGYL